ncbi:hypothetical protein EC973_006445 [Apophysomyces ossiformis]|uniref:Uncharacterized protein n=1 Tax=Apophysomyces ossiformis TaxID=679940 RepID=A0A8H7EUK7_9FUNG|nr:hypothetical protein EC973_006445 [Apophysomyces ossiformis]
MLSADRSPKQERRPRPTKQKQQQLRQQHQQQQQEQHQQHQQQAPSSTTSSHSHSSTNPSSITHSPLPPQLPATPQYPFWYDTQRITPDHPHHPVEHQPPTPTSQGRLGLHRITNSVQEENILRKPWTMGGNYPFMFQQSYGDHHQP